MPVYSYRTIRSFSEGSYKDKGSRFLAHAFPIGNEAEIKVHLDTLRRRYFDARHHCYAWMLGPERLLFRAADDGEPNHSAGDPILGQIRSFDLTNVLIVVVRYFGGIKLGVGGLITAYREAAADALRNAVIVEEEVTVAVQFTYPYERTPDVMRLVKDIELSITDQQYGDHCVLKANVALRNRETLLSKIALLNIHGKAIKTDMAD